MRSLRWTLIQSDQRSHKKERVRYMDRHPQRVDGVKRHRENATWRQRNGVMLSISQGAPKIASKPPDTRKRQERILPYRFQKMHGPGHTSIWTSSLQNCGRIYFCCSKPPSLQYFVRAALGNGYREHPQIHKSDGTTKKAFLLIHCSRGHVEPDRGKMMSTCVGDAHL